MRLGIDLGTTRTIVAVVDRGNYPVLQFEDPAGDAHDHVPSVVAWVDGALVTGYAALEAGRTRGVPVVRSFKRALGQPWVQTCTPVDLGGTSLGLLEVLTGFLRDLRTSLLEHSTLAVGPDEPLEAAVAVPAHATGAQRFLTLQAFRDAGFDAVALLNEPSAAGFEYSHRHARTITSKRTKVVVYDLGGGTFDASLVDLRGTHHDVTATAGRPDLGGDDFDAVLAGLVADRAGLKADDPELLEACRLAKERLTPQSKRLVVDLGEDLADVPVAEFYAAVTPLVHQTLDTVAPLLGDPDSESPELSEVAGIYLVGGGSALPLVPRLLRERFGRRVHSSLHPAASTAIGLAIAADDDSAYTITDRLSRGFGVFREGHEGTEVIFDELVGRHQRVLEGDVVVTRRYRAAHNVGWFRFVEYVDLDATGQPQGTIVPVAEFAFPFDRELQEGQSLAGEPVRRLEHGPEVEERYVVDPHGIVSVRITDLDSGHTRSHSWGQR